jgi:hypothetical protein
VYDENNSMLQRIDAMLRGATLSRYGVAFAANFEAKS